MTELQLVILITFIVLLALAIAIYPTLKDRSKKK